MLSTHTSKLNSMFGTFSDKCSWGLRFRCTDKIIFKTNTFFHGEIVYFEKDLCLTNQSISESMCCCLSNNQSLTSKIPIALKLKKIKIFFLLRKKANFDALKRKMVCCSLRWNSPPRKRKIQILFGAMLNCRTNICKSPNCPDSNNGTAKICQVTSCCVYSDWDWTY